MDALAIVLDALVTALEAVAILPGRGDGATSSGWRRRLFAVVVLVAIAAAILVGIWLLTRPATE